MKFIETPEEVKVMEEFDKELKETIKFEIKPNFDTKVCSIVLLNDEEVKELCMKYVGRINSLRKENKEEFYSNECSCSGDCNHE